MNDWERDHLKSEAVHNFWGGIYWGIVLAVCVAALLGVL